MNKKKTLLLLLISLFGQLAHTNATHIRGGEVKLELLSCNSLTIRATIILFRDTGSPDDIQAGGGILNFGDGNEVTIPEGGFTVNYLGSEVESNVYVIEHTYSSNGSYTVGYLEMNRNDGIINIASSVTTPFFVSSNVVIDSFLGCASSTPDYLSNPVFEGSINSVIEYSFAATSTDDNKLRYYLDTPKQDRDVPVGAYYVPDNVSVDSLSGMFKWDTTNGNIMEGEYSFAVKVIQYREIGGVYYQLGYVIRDVQLILHNTSSTLDMSDNLGDNNSNRVLLERNSEMTIVLALTDENSIDNYFEVQSELSEPNLVFETFSNANTESELIVTILSDENIVRDNPYIISVRASSVYDNGQNNHKDRNYLIYTKDVVEPNLVTSISNGLLAENRYVYPVPASRYIYLTNEQYGDRVSLYTLQGKLIKKEYIEDLKSVWIGDLREGNYLLVTSDEFVYRVVIDN